MSSSASPPTPSDPSLPSATPSGLVWLTLDEKGSVLQANRSAAVLFGRTSAELTGRALVELFEFDVVSAEPQFRQAQWDALVASATRRSTVLTTLPPEGAAGAEVRLVMEPLNGGPAAYVATIQVSPIHDGSGATTPADSPVWGLELLAHSPTLGFFDLHLDTGTVYYSPGWKRLLGYSGGDLDDTYATWLRLLHPDDTGAAPALVGRKPVAGERRTFAVEFRMKHRRDHWVWVQAVGLQAFGADGSLSRVVGVMLDVSDRKDFEELGLMAEDRLDRLTVEGQLALFDANFHTLEVTLSPAWDNLARRTEPTPFERLTAAFGAPTPPALEAELRAPSPGSAWFLRSHTLLPAQGPALPVLVGGHRQYSRRGDIVRVVGFVLPTRASGELSPELIRAGLDACHEGILITDERAQVRHLNRKAATLLGLPALSTPPPKLADVFRLVTAAEGHPADDVLDQALANPSATRLLTGFALAPGADRPARAITWSVAESRDASGSVEGLVVVFRDPEEMSLTPEELLRANRFETLGQLAGGIAHDFNNLLTTILGGISQAKDNREYGGLGDAETACLAAKTLTRQLLAAAKGSGSGSLQIVSPAEILRDAARIAAAGALARVHFEVEEQAGPIQVDRGQMLQVFQNLIINALQAMPEQTRGQLWLRCRAVELKAEQYPPLPAGSYVQMEVQDNGSGITREHLDRIFEPFFTTKKQGTGLGLSTVRSLVRKHGGQLGVSSQVGVGTTFSAFLPRSTQPIPTQARRGPSLRQGTGRVLLMDDDTTIRELTAAMLSSLDYTVDAAKTGDEAITLYRRYLNVNRPYDAVILDLTVIGGMGGEECFRRLKEMDPDVCAIVSSGYDDDEMVKYYLELGFTAYLTKPYRVSELARQLKSAVGR